MRKIKILFLIHDLGPGGAEKVLVNLVNNLNPEKFDISVKTLFAGGVNEQFLRPHIHYSSCFRHMVRGNSHLMKLLTPRQLHSWLITEQFDIEVSYLEGPAARIISGCTDKTVKLVSWIHVEQHTAKLAARSFRTYKESVQCYRRFCRVVCVSEYVKKDFQDIYPQVNEPIVLRNTNETTEIIAQKDEAITEVKFSNNEIKLCGMGKLMPIKGFDRIARIHKRLRLEGYPIHTYILGEGPERSKIDGFLRSNELLDSFTLLGYQTNPYKYLSKCDLFLCASTAEGFSTATTEALILGIPVCTVEVSGMKEMLGENNEYGIVAKNTEEALYKAIKDLLDHPEKLLYYRKQAEIRGKEFSTEQTVASVENFFVSLMG